MSQFFELHPDNPQPRLIKQAVAIVREGGIIAYPTDSSYALGCHIGDKSAMERIRRIRQLDDKHDFTLVCRDLSEISNYAKMDNTAFRLLKAYTPGPFTFIFKATHEVPRRLQHPKKKTIGIRLPDHSIAQALLEELGEPMMSSTLQLPGRDFAETEAWEIRERIDHCVDVIIEGGACSPEPTTIVDMSGSAPEIIRQGQGEIEI